MPYSSYILLALLLFPRTVRAINLLILFTHQCQHILFQDWYECLALCFAPGHCSYRWWRWLPYHHPHLTPNHQHDLPVSHTTTPSPSSGGGMQLLIAVCEHATGMPPTWPLVTQSSGTSRKRSGTALRISYSAPAGGLQRSLHRNMCHACRRRA
jgi:hypothetical protein